MKANYAFIDGTPIVTDSETAIVNTIEKLYQIFPFQSGSGKKYLVSKGVLQLSRLAVGNEEEDQKPVKLSTIIRRKTSSQVINFRKYKSKK